MIEFINGSEEHSSNWGKFYVKGLEQWRVKEDHKNSRSDHHHSYNFFMADAPDGTVFTIFEQNGDKHGTDEWSFLICVVRSDREEQQTKASYGYGFCKGPYDVVAQGVGKIKAPRLMDWWIKRPANVDPLAYATHCGVYIEKRGIKSPPALEVTPA